jgi:hypothetical protein
MAARLIFLLAIISALGAAILVLTGALAYDAVRISQGALGAVIATLLLGWLRRSGRMAEVVESINNFGGPDVPEEGFMHLVHEWEDLRVKRGTVGFDAWEFLRLRREIEAKAKDDPLLADYWRDHQV